MKTKNKFTRILIACAIAAFLLSGNGNLMAQQNTGVIGYETKHATVNFSEMMAYDAAHPELSTNIKNIPEAEYSHADFMRDHGIGLQNTSIVNQNANNNPVNKSKHIETVSPSPSLTFSGQISAGTMIPPDVFGAVGPNHVLTAHNQNVRITNKSGIVTYNVTLDAFWGSVTPAGVFDPKEVYDPYGGRYIKRDIFLDGNR